MDTKKPEKMGYCALFLASAGRPQTQDGTALEQALVSALASARAAYPGCAVRDEDFFRFLGERTAPDPSVEEALAQLHANDLYLACGCERGDPVALKLFDTQVLSRLGSMLSRFSLGDAGLADLKQALRVLLFVSDGEKPARVTQYSGRAPISAWVQVAAVRAAMRSKKQDWRTEPSEDQDLIEMPGSSDAPELGYLKQQYQAPFREAFRESLIAMDKKQRTLLRQSFIDGLSIDELGRLYGVHRATASRWIVEARRALLKATRERLVERIKLPAEECDSIMQLARSRLDITLRGLLMSRPQ